MNILRAEERGTTKISWLDSKHTFSFADYYNPQFVQYGALRVINEDIVAPGRGFGEHTHRDMEILTYVISGQLEHKDSMGNGSVLKAGSIQRMSAGTGVAHSEWNHSKVYPVHFLQIWVLPERQGLAPGYEEKTDLEHVPDQWLTLASNKPGAAVHIHQDLTLSCALIGQDKALTFDVNPGRKAWLQVVSGEVGVRSGEGTKTLQPGDGLAIEEVGKVTLTGAESRLLWFDLQQ